jgi:hypothetical protein
VPLIATLLAAGWLAGCSPSKGVAPAGLAPPTLLGLSANPVDGAPPDSFGTALLTALATGADFVHLGELWSDFEPSPGVYRASELRQGLAALNGIGYHVSFNLRAIDTNTLQLPADLAGKSFADSTLIARMDAVVDTLVSIAREFPLMAIVLGNEVDAWLAGNSAEFDAFRDLYAREAGRIHASLPAQRVGVTTISPVRNSNAWIGQQLNVYSDVAIYTYYPFQPGTDFLHLPPSTFEPDMAAMRAAAAGKVWALQEVGYSSSPVNASSDSLQADFARRFRTYVAAQRQSDLLYASWFLYTDFSPAFVSTLLGYYGLSSPGFAAYLGNLGLRRADGTPKPAWSAWRGLP